MNCPLLGLICPRHLLRLPRHAASFFCLESAESAEEQLHDGRTDHGNHLKKYITSSTRTRRGGSCLKDIYKTFLIYRTCMRRAPAKPVRACTLRNWCPVSHVTFEAPLRTSHFTVFTLHTAHCTLTLTLHTALFTLHTSHSTLHTLHTSHFTLHTSHFTLPHFTLHTPHFTLHTRFTLRTPHFIHTSHFTLHTPHFTLHTSHFTLQTSQSTLSNLTHTPHFTLHSSRPTLHTALFTLHTKRQKDEKTLFKRTFKGKLISASESSYESHLIPAHLFSSHLFTICHLSFHAITFQCC